MDTERSYGAALEVVTEQFQKRMSEEDLDERTKRAVTSGLVEDIFEQAWRFQFDEDRSKFKKEARSIVSNAVERAELSEADNAS